MGQRLKAIRNGHLEETGDAVRLVSTANSVRCSIGLLSIVTLQISTLGGHESRLHRGFNMHSRLEYIIGLIIVSVLFIQSYKHFTALAGATYVCFVLQESRFG